MTDHQYPKNEQTSDNQAQNCHQSDTHSNQQETGGCQNQQEQSEHSGQQEVISSVQSFEDLEKIVGNGVTLVDFWAPWCGPCRMQGPIVDSLAHQFAGKAKIAKIDVDQNSELAARFNVSAVPALFLFKDGKVVQEFVGVQTENTLNQALSSVV